MVLGAFARMRYRDRDMMFRIAESTPAILGQFAATDITLLAANADRFVRVFCPIHFSKHPSFRFLQGQSFPCHLGRGTTWQHLLVWMLNIAWFST